MAGLDPQLLELLTQTVTVEPFNVRKGDGSPVFGSPVTYQARVVNSVRSFYHDGQVDLVNWASIYLNYTPSITSEDRVTLPDGTQPIVQSVNSSPDEFGGYATIIYTWHKRGA
jgi:hypothetical protein